MGLPVLAVRTLAVLFGGAMAGLAGAYLSLAYTPMWAENMSAGRGWIALALVVFASWRVWRLLLGAYLFGLASILHLVAQGLGLAIPSSLLAMLPYVATIVVLVLLSRDARAHAVVCAGVVGAAVAGRALGWLPALASSRASPLPQGRVRRVNVSGAVTVGAGLPAKRPEQATPEPRPTSIQTPEKSPASELAPWIRA